MIARRRAAAWDLTALLNAADPRASLPERHLWLIRLLEWLRHAPVASVSASAGPVDTASTPRPVLRLRHLLGVLDRHPEYHQRVGDLLRRIWGGVDNAALLADFGFAPRMHLWSEGVRRLRTRILPLNPATTDLGELFALLFPHASDAEWLLAIDEATLERLRTYVGAESPSAVTRVAALIPESESASASAMPRTAATGSQPWRRPFLDSIEFLAATVRATGFSPALRQRMSPELLVGQPFRQLARAAERVGDLARALDTSPDIRSQDSGLQDGTLQDGSVFDEAALLREAAYLRALLDACRRCADSVHDHLETQGISVDLVFEVDQLRERTLRIDALLTCAISAHPGPDIARLIADLVRTADQRRSLRALFSRHYSLLARKVAERNAETGQHYITRTRAEYAWMLRAALGGGAVLAVTTFVEIGLITLAVPAFWGGLLTGLNYAVSLVVIQLLDFTVATKQPAMTAPALAEKLHDVGSDAGVERFVDEVAQMIRSQAAGIFGNLMAVAPLVLGAQLIAQAIFGAPIVGSRQAGHVLDSLTLLGPTALFAALTGVLLFASSLIAGWAENWFVWHRLDSAIAWNPRIVARLGAARAQRWGAYWRRHVSGFASNVSLGLLMGIVPALAVFFGLGLDVRHVTLSTGQLAAALGSEGIGLLRHGPFWWCVAGIVATGALNLSVSFWLAFRVALRSRGIRTGERSRIYRAVGSRLWHRPRSFVWPTDPARL